ncbi:PEP-CTERM sorting domain-containing protein [Altericista sp. CCNU0014]|uniref:PEP-CTERM sorting domain-containing protein n=1 Tax=Altericista sp. CCNU0014 TaxID=3082949 RepID=UPI003850F5E4
MKNKVIQKFSPLALGLMVFSYPIVQGSMAYGASLKSAAGADSQLLKPVVPDIQASPSGVAVGCGPSPAGSSLVPPDATRGASSAASDVVASSAMGSVAPATVVANAPALDSTTPSLGGENLSSNLVAQALPDDCCEIGGTTTCEIGGAPPTGGGVLGGGPSPLLALLGLPAALVPAFLGGGNGDDNGTPPTPTPVPEPSSTGALAAGFGLIGLWYGRRLRSTRKTFS